MKRVTSRELEEHCLRANRASRGDRDNRDFRVAASPGALPWQRRGPYRRLQRAQRTKARSLTVFGILQGVTERAVILRKIRLEARTISCRYSGMDSLLNHWRTITDKT